MEQGHERRKHYRLSKILAAEIDYGIRVEKIDLFVVDISCGGFRATSDKKLSKGQNMAVRLYLHADQMPLMVDAQLVWLKELTRPDLFEMGFQFDNLSQEAWKTLEDFIETERQRRAQVGFQLQPE